MNESPVAFTDLGYIYVYIYILYNQVIGQLTGGLSHETVSEPGVWPGQVDTIKCR